MRALEGEFEKDRRLGALREWVERHFREERREDPGHDVSHALRVAHWALRLASPDVPPASIIAAALLHDLVNPPKDLPLRKQASAESAREAARLLPDFGFPETEATLIADAIRTHSFSRGEEPTSELGRVIQDADRLEALGAIGLFRVLATGVQLKAELFDAADPWAERRPLDDRRYSVDHFFLKLLKLPTTMKTEAGRREAERRVKLLREFLENLGEEIGTPVPPSRFQARI